MLDLVGLGISKKRSATSAKFESLCSGLGPEDWARSGLTPSEYLTKWWTIAEQGAEGRNNARGAFFEYTVAAVLHACGVGPFYTYADSPLVPNVEFDILMYEHEFGPVVLSIKTSLRERYKQADLEAFAMRAVFRRAETYLVTLDEEEAGRESKKLEAGKMLALNGIVVATSPDFDDLLGRLRGKNLVSAPSFPLVRDLQREVRFHRAAH